MHDEARRRFFLGTGAGLVLLGCARAGATPTSNPKSSTVEEAEEEVAPPEDLMREHGVLNRILLIYEESARRLEAGQALPINVVASGADIIQRFIERYHEKLEEDFLFPRFEKANVLVDLVGTLRRQHEAGRVVTDEILSLSKVDVSRRADDRKALAASLRKFIRMYRPHEAREDTVLFPALRRVVTPKEFETLGEQFEDKEHELFGREGFEGIVEKVATLEKQLGTYDLDSFTPV